MLARDFGKMCVSCGFWVHLIGGCWQVFSFFLFKAGASALKLFFAGDGYADSHISTASTSHRGEDLCSLNTTSWGWNLSQHSMRHRLFQCGNWFSPFHGRLLFQIHRSCGLSTHPKSLFLGPFLGNMWHHQSTTWFVSCLPWVSDVQMSNTFWHAA